MPQSFEEYPFLKNIDTPEDLRKYPVSDLRAICADIREYLIDTISQTGGHFGAGLGVVELTVALHYVLNTPKDKLIWDVGHQAYPHKIIRHPSARHWGLQPRAILLVRITLSPQ
jgi:1-deoxy-D-xylulose-5-phosphate synthase